MRKRGNAIFTKSERLLNSIRYRDRSVYRHRGDGLNWRPGSCNYRQRAGAAGAQNRLDPLAAPKEKDIAMRVARQLPACRAGDEKIFAGWRNMRQEHLINEPAEGRDVRW